MPPHHALSTIAIALSLLASSANGMPLPLTRREMTNGAKAGMGIGVAVAVVLLLLVLTLLTIHFRRASHIRAINRQRAILSGEKNLDGSDKFDKFGPLPPLPPPSAEKGGATATATATPAPGLAAPPAAALVGRPRRNKSVKDRLMGPLYRDSTIDLEPLPLPPGRPRRGGGGGGAAAAGGNRDSTATTVTIEYGPDGQPLNTNGLKPWATRGSDNNSPRDSFSSKRATRMMMLM